MFFFHQLFPDVSHPPTQFQSLPPPVPSVLKYSKEKKMKTKLKQTKRQAKQNKNTIRIFGLNFVSVNYSWAQACPTVWLMYFSAADTVEFVVSSRYQVQIASWLRMGFCIHFPSSVLWLCLFWTCTGFLCMCLVLVMASESISGFYEGLFIKVSPEQ